MSLDHGLSAQSRPTRATSAIGVEPSLSWSAILAGAAVSLALSLLLLVLAAGFGMQLGGFGLATRGSLAGFTPVLGAWAIVAQVAPAALGGYLSGRLRHGWTGVHGDEGHFRDTAQGLIAWAVATLAGAVLLAALIGPYNDHIAGGAAADAATTLSTAELQRAANIAAQAAYFAALGMLLSAFVSAVAARLGGLTSEEMSALP